MLKSIVRLVLVVLILLHASRAAAWCLLDKGLEYRTFWKDGFPDLRIKVHISLGEKSSFLRTGLTLPQAEAIVRRVVATHNETVGPPYLVYAGTTTTELNPTPAPEDSEAKLPYEDRPVGIVLESFVCGDWPCNPDVHACAIISGKTNPQEVARGRVSFRPAKSDCPGIKDHTWGLEFSFGSDAAGILLHELGHTLGLDHTNLSGPECAGPTDGEGAFGVMRPPPSALYSNVRDWRRDDLEGLRAIYGNAFEHAVYSWQDTEFPESQGEAPMTPLCADVRTPPALSSAVSDDTAVETLFVAFTDAADRVKHLEWVGDGFVPPAIGAEIEPFSEFGGSFGPVGIAHSDTGQGAGARVLAVWTTAESKMDPRMRVRWALRDLVGGPWIYGFLATPDGPEQGSKDVNVGFDPGTAQFVITGITDRSHPYFVALDLAGNQGAPLVLGEGFLTPPFVVDIGKANCFADGAVSRCVVPYASSGFTATDAMDAGYEPFNSGWYDIELHADGSIILIDDALTPDPLAAELSSRGMLDLASGPDGFRGVIADRRYALERAPGEGAADAPALDAAALAAGDWPIRIGSQKLSADATTYRIAARKLEKLCGNGLVDCDEECDDGNGVDDDGCSIACSLEPSPTTGEVTGGPVTGGTFTEGEITEGMTTAGPATATDTGVANDADGCGCTAEGGRGSVGIWALMGGLSGRRRSRAS